MLPFSAILVSSLLVAAGVYGQDTTASETSAATGTTDATVTTSTGAQLSVDPDAWVTVDDNGSPTTITPVTTTIDGTRTVIDAAPDVATDTVRTKTVNGHITTETNSAVIAAPTASSGAGSFTVCSNKDGDYAPFCEIAGGQPLIIGSTYYIKWDPTFYESNTTVEITGNYINDTTQEVETQAFSSGERQSQWGFWVYSASSDVLQSGSNVTVQLTIFAIQPSDNTPLIENGPRITIKKEDTQSSTVPPTQKHFNKTALTIALPVSLAAVAFITVGLCLWNRKTRRIDIKNVMGRGKKGYGISKSRMQRLGKVNYGKENQQQDVPLMDLRGERVYRDDPYNDGIGGTSARSRTPGGLGGALGKKDDDRFRFNLGPGAGHNAFREELRRQGRDKLS